MTLGFNELMALAERHAPKLVERVGRLTLENDVVHELWRLLELAGRGFTADELLTPDEVDNRERESYDNGFQDGLDDARSEDGYREEVRQRFGAELGEAFRRGAREALEAASKAFIAANMPDIESLMNGLDCPYKEAKQAEPDDAETPEPKG